MTLPLTTPDVHGCGIEPKRLQKRLRPLERLAKERPATESPGLVLHEIYGSVQGESTHAGKPCTFVRTTACHLRCVYCDTPHAFGEGTWWSITNILEEVARLGLPTVELTGGEPLLQPQVYPLMTELCDRGYTVLLETSGSLDLQQVDRRVHKIVDFKTPSSGEEPSNRYAIIEQLTATDEVKLVLGSREDYEWARSLMERHRLWERCPVVMGTVHGALEPQVLARWLVEDRSRARMQIQLHKVLWDPAARGV